MINNREETYHIKKIKVMMTKISGRYNMKKRKFWKRYLLGVEDQRKKIV